MKNKHELFWWKGICYVVLRKYKYKVMVMPFLYFIQKKPKGIEEMSMRYFLRIKRNIAENWIWNERRKNEKEKIKF